MTEYIIHLTDEQEALVRRDLVDGPVLRTPADADALRHLASELMGQVRAALALYDRLVAEAKAKSDD